MIKRGGITEKVEGAAKETANQVKQNIPNYGMEGSKKNGEAHVGNKNYNVGG